MALYVSNIGGKIWQKDNNGFIAKVSPDGKMIERQWLVGSLPTGLALDGGKLYVADIDQLVEIDMRRSPSPSAIPRQARNGSTMWRATAKATVYVANSATNTIWRLKDGKFEAWLTDRSAQLAERTSRRGRHVVVAPFGAMAEGARTRSWRPCLRSP